VADAVGKGCRGITSGAGPAKGNCRRRRKKTGKKRMTSNLSSPRMRFLGRKAVAASPAHREKLAVRRGWRERLSGRRASEKARRPGQSGKNVPLSAVFDA